MTRAAQTTPRRRAVVRMVHLGHTKLVRMAASRQVAVLRTPRGWLSPNWERVQAARCRLAATRGSNGLASRVHRRGFHSLHSATRNESPDRPILHTTDWRLSTVG